jgi:hypothetical protein
MTYSHRFFLWLLATVWAVPGLAVVTLPDAPEGDAIRASFADTRAFAAVHVSMS